MSRLLLATFAAVSLFPGASSAQDKSDKANDPRPSLQLGVRATARFSPSPDDPTVVLLPVRAVLVKELSIKLVTVREGTAETVSTTRLLGGTKDQGADPASGHLVLVLKPSQKGKVVEPYLGYEFGKSAFGGAVGSSGGAPPAVSTSPTKLEFVSKTANWPSDKAAVVYGQAFGFQDKKGESEDVVGKSVEEVARISKQHPHLSYILVVLSWSGPKVE